jgi:hypothetical protein
MVGMSPAKRSMSDIRPPRPIDGVSRPDLSNNVARPVPQPTPEAEAAPAASPQPMPSQPPAPPAPRPEVATKPVSMPAKLPQKRQKSGVQKFIGVLGWIILIVLIAVGAWWVYLNFFS